LIAGADVDALFAAKRRTQRRIALHEYAIAAAVKATLVGPEDDKAAVGQACDLRLDLVAAHMGIDSKLGAGRNARTVVALGIDAVTASILPAGSPHHHIAATCERGHARLVLVVRGIGIDALFWVDSHGSFS